MVGVALKMDSKSTCVLKRIGPCAQNMLTIPGSVVNIMGGGGTYTTIQYREIRYSWAPKIMRHMAMAKVWMC